MSEHGPECPGQLLMVCAECNGQRIVGDDYNLPAPCLWCDGSGIDLRALPALSACQIDSLAEAYVVYKNRSGEGKGPGNF